MKRVLSILLTILAFSYICHAESEIISFRLSSREGLPDNSIRYITNDSVGNKVFLWSTGGALYDGYRFTMLDDKDFTRIETQFENSYHRNRESRTDNRGNQIFIDEQNGTVTYRSRLLTDILTFKIFDRKILSLNNNLKVTLITDKNGRIWISTNGNGLFLYDPADSVLRHITATDNTNLIDSDNIIFMTEDEEGNIWISQDKYGVACIRVIEKPYTVIYPDSTAGSERERSIRLLKRLANDSIIIANDYGSVYVSCDDLKGFNTLINSGEDNYISAEVADDGKLWLGSRTRGVTGAISVSDGRIDCILRDSNSDMWICGIDKSVIRYNYNDNGWIAKRIFLSDYNSLKPRAIIEDYDGMIYIASSIGIFKLSPVPGTQSYGITKISEIPVISFCTDGKGGLWCATRGNGVLHLVKHGVTYTEVRYTTEDGIAHNSVNSIIMDKAKNIWIGTIDGISMFTPQENLWYSIKIQNSILQNYCNENSIAVISDGRIAFGSLNGIVVTSPDLMKSSTENASSKIAITGISINGAPLPYNEVHRITMAGHIELPYDKNSIRIYVSDFRFATSTPSLYTFTLRDNNNTVLTQSGTNYTCFDNLSSGNYTLQIQAKNIHDTPIPLHIRIKPAPWSSPYAITIYIIVTCLLLYLFIRYTGKQLRLKEALRLEKRITEFRTNFFIGLSHEFRTSLTLINASMYGLREDISSGRLAKLRIKRMENNVTRMARIVNQLMDFKQLEDNRLRLTLQLTDVSSFIRNLYFEFKDLAQNKGVNLIYYSALKSELHYIDRGIVDKITHNLLSYALNSAQENKTITLSLCAEDGFLLIAISGPIDMPAANSTNPFEHYSNIINEDDSIGIGLNFTESLVKAHRGIIEYRSNHSDDSRFEVRLPLDRTCYNSSNFIESCEVTQPIKTTEYTTEICVKPKPVNAHSVLFIECDGKYGIKPAGIIAELERMYNISSLNLNQTGQSINLQHPVELTICNEPTPSQIKKIKNSPTLKDIPLIAICDSTQAAQKALASGADAFLTHPIDIALLLSLCKRLIESKVKAKGLPVIMSNTDSRFLNLLNNYIDNHLDSTAIDEACHTLGISKATLTRKISEVTGVTPKEYINRRKMNIAIDLLNKRTNVAEIAEKLGFSSPQNFSTSFKRYIGVSPTEYRRQSKG